MPGGIKPKGSHGLVDPNIPGANQPCAYCKRKMIAWTVLHPTDDHIVPKSKGGLETVRACYQCNQFKADMMPDEWERVMRENPGWWEIPGLGAKIRNGLRKDNGVCPVIAMVADVLWVGRYPYLKRWRRIGAQSRSGGQPPLDHP